MSCFRYRTPRSEFVRAAGTRLITRMVGGGEPGMPLSDEPTEPQWTSFACVLVRREVFQQIGLLDEGFFMYFEDLDFCRRARTAGWTILNWPAAHVVHLRGGSSPVKDATQSRKRLPKYFYESRARYFARYYGRAGLWLTNLLWGLGSMVSIARARLQSRPHHLCQKEWSDNWTNALKSPPRASAHGRQGAIDAAA